MAVTVLVACAGYCLFALFFWWKYQKKLQEAHCEGTLWGTIVIGVTIGIFALEALFK